MIAEFGLEIVLLIGGFLVLMKSAQSAIRRIIRIAQHYGMPEFAVSFLAVGVISILPELAIAINSAFANEPAFGLGLVFGSNVADLTLVIGLVALFSQSIRLSKHVLSEMRWLFLFLLLPVLLLADGELGTFDGALLVLAFFWYAYRVLKDNPRGHINRVPKPNPALWADALVLLLAVVLLLVSGNVITNSALLLSSHAGLPVFFIGILVAIGTCLPELTVALNASERKHSELGFGDIMGNVFADSTLTIGILALIHPIRPRFHALTMLSGLFMTLALLVLVWLFFGKKQLGKREGVYLVLLYLAYLLGNLVLERALWIG